MKPNVGSVDGYLRILFFLASLCYAILIGCTVAWVAAGIGAILFTTSVLMWCPLFAMFGINMSKVY